MATSLLLKPVHTKREIMEGLPEAIQEGWSCVFVPHSQGKMSYRLLSFAYVVLGLPREDQNRKSWAFHCVKILPTTL